ncbi:hypothetical protein AWZ03_015253, partial [Drosophila navojoa]
PVAPSEEMSSNLMVQRMLAIEKKLRKAVVVEAVPSTVALNVLDLAAKYQELVLEMYGRIKELETVAQTRPKVVVPPIAVPVAAPVASYAAVTATAAAAPIAAPRARKIAETWSAIVTSNNPEETPRQVAERIRKDVAPALGVRVHEVRELKRGGAIIRTPSSGEIRRVLANPKFKEVGLDVKENAAVRPRVNVLNVDSSITPKQFMEGLYKNHFLGHCSNAAFEKSVRISSKPWNSDVGPTVNVQLEMERKALDILEESERIYVEWFSFRWNPITPTYACH